jgi:Na+/H+ antiporter NhaD/arsenite permease-like protein
MSFPSNLAIPVIVLTFIGVAAGEFPGLKMNRATIALVAAVLLVVLQIITPSAALKAIDPGMLLLLFSMMIVSTHLEIAGFFTWVGQLIARPMQSPRQLLAWIMAIAGVMAALFLNDTVAVVFTPLVLEVTRSLRRDPLPYLLGLATAVNIGSVATITGNPQNILIGSSSQIPFAVFLTRLGPVALIGLALAWIILVQLYRNESKQSWQGQTAILNHVEIDQALLRKSLVLTGLMIVAFLVGISMQLAAITVAAALLISRRIQPEAIFERVDWSLLVFFGGLFIVTGVLEQTQIVDQLFSLIRPMTGAGVGPLALITAVLSNLISNVPAVLLFRSIVPQLGNPVQAWLTLAMASTLAGNLTLLGSVANLIIAETARAQGVKISFREYLRAGIPITLVTMLVGVLCLSIFG